MKRTKIPRYLDWVITDAFIMSDEWDSLHYDLRYELDALRDKGKFLACKDETFAHAYLGHAEEIIRKKGNWEISTLSTIRELREAIKDPHAWRVFMQTLLLVTITNRSGVIPEVAQAGREFKKDQSNKGGRRWQDKTDELKTRNTKIFEHFKKTRFSARRFAELHAPKYGLKPTQIRAILSKMEVAG